MTEARIFCKTRNLRIGDLGLTLLRGEVVYLPLEQASKSKDLKVARLAGAVEVTPIQRARETRVPGTPPPAPRKPLKAPLPAAPVPNMEADVSQAVQRAVDAGLSGIRDMLKGFIGQGAGKVVEVVVPVRQTPNPFVPPDEPHFIPKDLVGKAKAAEITVQENQTDGAGVDEATTALRRARRKKA